MAEPLLARNFHPTVIIKGYGQALQCCLDTLKNICRVVDTNNTDELRELVKAAIGTKFSGRWGAMMVDMAIDAVRKVVVQRGDYTEVDVKRYVRVEKIHTALNPADLLTKPLKKESFDTHRTQLMRE